MLEQSERGMPRASSHARGRRRALAALALGGALLAAPAAHAHDAQVAAAEDPVAPAPTYQNGTVGTWLETCDDTFVAGMPGCLAPVLTSDELPARQESSYVEVGGKLYLIGGEADGIRPNGQIGSVKQPSILVFDPVANEWSDTGDRLKVAVDHVQGVAIGTKIYLIGGLTGFDDKGNMAGWPYGETAAVQIYDTVTGAVELGTPIARDRARAAGGIAVYKGRIYMAGGLHDGKAVRMFDEFDPKANGGKGGWTQLEDMPDRDTETLDILEGSDHFAAVVAKDKFWAIAGRDVQIKATHVENAAYDFLTKKWTTTFKPGVKLKDAPIARGGHGAAVVGDEILLIGGETHSANELKYPEGRTLRAVDAYNMTTNTWRVGTTPEGYKLMPTQRHGVQAAVCGDGIYIAGGGLRVGRNPITAHEALFTSGTVTACAPEDETPTPETPEEPRETPPVQQPGPTPPVTEQPRTDRPAAPTGTAAGGQDATPAPAAPAQQVAPTRSERDSAAPVLRLTLSQRSFRRALRTSLRVSLSEAATLRLSVEKVKRSAGRVRYVRVKGVLSRPAALGTSAVRMDRRLSAGSYRLVVTATDAAGNRSPAVRAGFVVTR